MQGTCHSPRSSFPRKPPASRWADGTVDRAGEWGGNQQIGQIQVARFINASGLESLGQNLFANSSPGPPIVLVPGEQGAGRIAQGMLEASNAMS